MNDTNSNTNESCSAIDVKHCPSHCWYLRKSAINPWCSLLRRSLSHKDGRYPRDSDCRVIAAMTIEAVAKQTSMTAVDNTTQEPAVSEN